MNEMAGQECTDERQFERERQVTDETRSAAVAAAIGKRIKDISRGKERILVAIDGRTTAGKTTVAEWLRRRTGCNIVHMDDFFLRPEQRTAERYAMPGGNADYERVRRDIIDPWLKTGAFSYEPYDAHADTYEERLYFAPKPVTVVEGAYSTHPALCDAYDLTVFLTIEATEQEKRVLQRNGAEALAVFQNKWIPLEEAYIRETMAENRSDMVFQMGRSAQAAPHSNED